MDTQLTRNVLDMFWTPATHAKFPYAFWLDAGQSWPLEPTVLIVIKHEHSPHCYQNFLISLKTSIFRLSPLRLAAIRNDDFKGNTATNIATIRFNVPTMF